MPRTPDEMIEDEIRVTQADINRLEAKASLPSFRRGVAKAETKLKEAKVNLERVLKVAKGGK